MSPAAQARIEASWGAEMRRQGLILKAQAERKARRERAYINAHGLLAVSLYRRLKDEAFGFAPTRSELYNALKWGRAR
jgi:hypothetical protein